MRSAVSSAAGSRAAREAGPPSRLLALRSPTPHSSPAPRPTPLCRYGSGAVGRSLRSVGAGWALSVRVPLCRCGSAASQGPGRASALCRGRSALCCPLPPSVPCSPLCCPLPPSVALLHPGRSLLGCWPCLRSVVSCLLCLLPVSGPVAPVSPPLRPALSSVLRCGFNFAELCAFFVPVLSACRSSVRQDTHSG